MCRWCLHKCSSLDRYSHHRILYQTQGWSWLCAMSVLALCPWLHHQVLSPIFFRQEIEPATAQACFIEGWWLVFSRRSSKSRLWMVDRFSFGCIVRVIEALCANRCLKQHFTLLYDADFVYRCLQSLVSGTIEHLDGCQLAWRGRLAYESGYVLRWMANADQLLPHHL